MFTVREHEKRDIYWWYSRAHTINFSPSYQRKGQLWDVRRKAQLIDSIINGYDLPKFYMVDFTSSNSKLNESSHDYAVVDGKQRLETIFGFLDNEFALAKNFHYFGKELANIGGLTYRELQYDYPFIVDTLTKYTLPVMSIVTDELARIDEMYIRLNVGISLNGAEVRNAMPGIVPELIRRMVIHEFFTEKILFKTWRMQDFNVAVKLLIIEQNGSFVDTKKSTLDRFTRQGEGLFAGALTEAYEKSQGVLNNMCKVFQDKDILLRTEAPVPIYYWLVRNISEDLHREIRPFLLGFETAMREYRQSLHNGSMVRNTLLDMYSLSSRSSNDPGSMRQRYEILMTEFRNWTSTGRCAWTVKSDGDLFS